MSRTTQQEQARKQRITSTVRTQLALHYGLAVKAVSDSAILGQDYMAVLSRVSRELHQRLDSFGSLGPDSSITDAADFFATTH